MRPCSADAGLLCARLARRSRAIHPDGLLRPMSVLPADGVTTPGSAGEGPLCQAQATLSFPAGAGSGRNSAHGHPASSVVSGSRKPVHDCCRRSVRQFHVAILPAAFFQPPFRQQPVEYYRLFHRLGDRRNICRSRAGGDRRAHERAIAAVCVFGLDHLAGHTSCAADGRMAACCWARRVR